MTRWISPVLFAAVFAVRAAAQSTQPAVIVVRVPADAEVVIGSQKMTLTGPERRFVTGPLEKGTYTYDVTVSWTDGKTTYKKIRQVTFSPGKTAVIEFNSPPALAQAEPQPPVLTSVYPGNPKSKATYKVLDGTSDPVADADKSKIPKSRTFVFTYAGKVTGLPPGKTAKIWLPSPPNTPEQTVNLESSNKLLPVPFNQVKEDKLYGTPIRFAELAADAKGEIAFRLDYRVTRREVKTDAKLDHSRTPTESADLLARYLKPDAKVPIDGKPLDLVKDTKVAAEPVVAAKTFYDVVNGHVKYSKEGTGWGQGDSVWVCDSKFGNCTDFHSLFISLARGHKIPAKFEMGFSIPPKRGEGPIAGYHCWAWFMACATPIVKYEGPGAKLLNIGGVDLLHSGSDARILSPGPDKGWIPVDVSEANRHPDMKDYYFGNLTEDRVQFSTGRDITLEPRQSGPALNFFIYPYVEVDGKPYEKVERTFGYKDMGGKP